MKDYITVIGGGLTLNTPIVIYSWKEVVDALVSQNIVTLTDGVYYITDMNKLINFILTGKKWSDIGLKNWQFWVILLCCLVIKITEHFSK